MSRYQACPKCGAVAPPVRHEHWDVAAKTWVGEQRCDLCFPPTRLLYLRKGAPPVARFPTLFPMDELDR